jgi:hypothetical protein
MKDRDGCRLSGLRRQSRCGRRFEGEELRARAGGRLDDAVAVIADDMWAAQEGLAALSRSAGTRSERS